MERINWRYIIPVLFLCAAAYAADKDDDYQVWGPEVNGLRTRLVPAQKEFTLGKPAWFRLELRNFGKTTRKYNDRGVGVNDTFAITDPDGKPVPYVGGVFQNVGSEDRIESGELVYLLESIDLTDQYLFTKPGTYTLKFHGKSNSGVKFGLGESNTISIEMKPGRLPIATQVPARLIDILPEKWIMCLNSRMLYVQLGNIAPPGWESGPGTYVLLVRDYNLRNGIAPIHIWVAENQLKPKEKNPDDKISVSYWGKGADGYVYATLSKAAKEKWPDAEAKIKTALKINQ